MAVDKLVDSTQLNSDLTSVANAIRTKGGTSASLAFPSDFVSAIGAISTGGGSEILSGSITPTEDTNGMSIDVGSSDFTHFVVYPSAFPGGNNIKAFVGAICDFSLQTNTNISTMSTNNTGSSTIANTYSTPWFSKSGSVITCITGTSGTTVPGYWANGITYYWFAW